MKLFRIHLLTLCLLALSFVGAKGLWAQDSYQGPLMLPVGQAQILTFERPITRIAVAEPTVAEVMVISPYEAMLSAKSIGTTTLIVWEEGRSARTRPVAVLDDIVAVEQRIKDQFPGEEISIQVSGKAVLLTGKASTAAVAQEAVEIAATSGLEVVNQLRSPSPPQILLQVRFAEVSRTAMDQIGVSWDLQSSGSEGGRSGSVVSDAEGTRISLSDAINLFVLGGNARLGVLIDALRERGDYKTLAEPNLLALNETKASFLAGGEFPYPIVENDERTTVAFKEYGVRLSFLPRVTSSGTIRLQVAPEVSSLDFANGTEVVGLRIPLVLSRRAETEVELKDGQTFAIAGLMDHSFTENLRKVPLLGDIPILGELFRSEDVRKRKTELLVLVTPHILDPAAGTKNSLPHGVEDAIWSTPEASEETQPAETPAEVR